LSVIIKTFRCNWSKYTTELFHYFTCHCWSV